MPFDILKHFNLIIAIVFSVIVLLDGYNLISIWSMLNLTGRIRGLIFLGFYILIIIVCLKQYKLIKTTPALTEQQLEEIIK